MKVQEEIGQIDQSLADMDSLIAKLQPGGVTGFFDTWIAGIFDKAAGSQDRGNKIGSDGPQGRCNLAKDCTN